jgi:murein DD-endopeptidase MepM/ murein hydrolase activator NlpD
VNTIGPPIMAAPTLDRRAVLDKGDPAEAAAGLEAFFIRQFLALARPQTPGMLDGGFAGDTFREMLDDKLADAISDSGGLGLAASFEGALGGERPPPMTRPMAPTLVDQIDGARALAGAAAGGQAGGGPMLHPAAGRYSSGFGQRVDPLGAGTGFHPGLDIAAPKGAAVTAAAAGEVIHAGPAGTYGNMIAIRHADGTETRYAHLSAVDVKVGDRVAAGAALGAVGSTGRSTGPHLHFEVRRDGKAVNPRPYLDGAAKAPNPGHLDDLNDRFSSPAP